MTTQPSSAPQWAKDAAEDMFTMLGYGSRSSINVASVAAIITKHAAAISEENRQLREDNLRLTHVKESYQQRAYEFSAQLTTLRQWTEQAGEAMRGAIIQMEYEAAMMKSGGFRTDSIEQATARLRALLAAHPAYVVAQKPDSLFANSERHDCPRGCSYYCEKWWTSKSCAAHPAQGMEGRG